MKFTIALLQVAPFGDDQEKNLEKGLRCCRNAKALGADLAVFPELWNIGGPKNPVDAGGRQRWIASAIDERGYFIRSFTDLARELDLNIAITYLEAHNPKPKNSVCIIDRRGHLTLNYSKVFICNFGERELSKPNPNRDEIGCDVNCTAGDSFEVCSLSAAGGQVRVGAMICSDREFPEPATQLALNGAELIIVPNACTWDDIRTAGLQTRAFENLVGIAMANYPPPPNNGTSLAYTCVAWRDGKEVETLLARAGEREEILLATFNMDDIRAFTAAESWRMEYRRAAPKFARHRDESI